MNISFNNKKMSVLKEKKANIFIKKSQKKNITYNGFLKKLIACNLISKEFNLNYGLKNFLINSWDVLTDKKCNSIDKKLFDIYVAHVFNYANNKENNNSLTINSSNITFNRNNNINNKLIEKLNTLKFEFIKLKNIKKQIVYDLHKYNSNNNKETNLKYRTNKKNYSVNFNKKTLSESKNIYIDNKYNTSYNNNFNTKIIKLNINNKDSLFYYDNTEMLINNLKEYFKIHEVTKEEQISILFKIINKLNN